MNKKMFVLLSLVTIFLTSLLPVTSVYGEEEFTVAAEAAFAVDAETGKILYNQNGDTALGIASVTKILSMYLVAENVASGSITWDDQVTISEYAASLSTAPDFSNVPLAVDQTYSVRELYHAAIIESANGAVVALAEYIAGSEPTFIDQMREKLNSWGITDAAIWTSSGLSTSDVGEGNAYPDAPADQENTMSARDVAIVASNLITDFPEVLEVSKTATEVFAPGTATEYVMNNWNWMLPGFLNAKDGVDGLKTGTTDFAGACFVGTINRDGRRLITVVLNASNAAEDAGARFNETSRLMDYCYENWQYREINTANLAVPKLASLDVPYGKQLTVPVALKENVTMWIRNDMNEENITISPTIDSTVVSDDHVLAAPVDKGLSIGSAAVALNEDTLGYLGDAPTTTVEIVTTESVEAVNFFVKLWRNVKNFFSDLF